MGPVQVVHRAAAYLERHGVESPVATAERLLSHVLGTDRTGIYARDGLTTEESKRFGRALCRRCAGEPLQHVTGEQAFRNVVLSMRPGVFVPRPETELLVEAALEQLRDVPGPVVADVGAGSGAVALAIKDERPDATVLATDLSADAVALARENAERLGLAIEVFEGDLLEPLPPERRGGLDAVVANPPYVPIEDRDGLPPEVLAEPPLAVFGDGAIYTRLFAGAARWLRSDGRVVVEIEERAAASVGRAAADAGFVDVVVRPDLTGRDRVVTARRP